MVYANWWRISHSLVEVAHVFRSYFPKRTQTHSQQSRQSLGLLISNNLPFCKPCQFASSVRRRQSSQCLCIGIASEGRKSIPCIKPTERITDEMALLGTVSLEQLGKLATDRFGSHINSVRQPVDDRQKEQISRVETQLSEMGEERESELLEDWSSEIESEHEGCCHIIYQI